MIILAAMHQAGLLINTRPWWLPPTARQPVWLSGRSDGVVREYTQICPAAQHTIPLNVCSTTHTHTNGVALLHTDLWTNTLAGVYTNLCEMKRIIIQRLFFFFSKVLIHLEPQASVYYGEIFKKKTLNNADRIPRRPSGNRRGVSQQRL